MDKSYMLNDYISEQEKDIVNLEDANSVIEKLQFRIKGCKTVEEIKKEFEKFLEKNNIPFEVEEKLKNICSQFDENTDVYHCYIYLENYMKEYLNSKEQKSKDSSDTVLEIKEDVVESAKKDLDSVGITLTGNTDNLVNNIQNEDDIYKIKDNVEKTTEYFEEKKEDGLTENKTILEMSYDEIETVLEEPSDTALLDNILEQEEQITDSNLSPEFDFKEDGSIEIQGDATNHELTNFVAMMTNALVVSSNDYGFNNSFDMKFIKDLENINKFKIIYSNPQFNENNLRLNNINKISNLVKEYKSHVSYQELLGKNSLELMTSLTIIQEHILGRNGMFQMTLKNSVPNHEMIFTGDENYDNVSTAFYESGAIVTHNAMEHSIIKVNDTMPGDRLIILSSTLDNLRQKQIENNQNTLTNQNQYQKKLIYPDINSEAANASKTFLMISIITDVILLLITYIFFLVK